MDKEMNGNNHTLPTFALLCYVCNWSDLLASCKLKHRSLLSLKLLIPFLVGVLTSCLLSIYS